MHRAWVKVEMVAEVHLGRSWSSLKLQGTAFASDFFRNPRFLTSWFWSFHFHLMRIRTKNCQDNMKIFLEESMSVFSCQENIETFVVRNIPAGSSVRPYSAFSPLSLAELIGQVYSAGDDIFIFNSRSICSQARQWLYFLHN